MPACLSEGRDDGRLPPGGAEAARARVKLRGARRRRPVRGREPSANLVIRVKGYAERVGFLSACSR